MMRASFSLRVIIIMIAFVLPSIVVAETSNPLPPSGIAAGGGSPPAESSEKLWKLDSEYFHPAVMDMVLVHPRPDEETNSWARHRNAYPGLLYEIPIVVQGGAFPFYFEVLEGPSNMRVENDTSSESYGVLRWNPSQEDVTHPVTIRVIDQEWNEEFVSFDLRVTKDNFIFVDPSVQSSGAGTIDDPVKDLREIFADGDHERTTFPGKLVYLRKGVHELMSSSDEVNDGRIRLSPSRMPYVYLGFPGEEPVIDFSNGMIVANASGSGDFYISDIVFLNTTERASSRNSPYGSRFFHVWAGERFTYFRNKWINIRSQPNYSGGNEGGIHSQFSDVPRRYYAFVGNYFEDYNTRALGSFYSLEYAVFENNEFGPANGSPGANIDLKSDVNYASIRRNTSIETTARNGLLQNYGGRNSGLPLKVEFSYNLINIPEIVSSSSGAGAIAVGRSVTDQNGMKFYAWIYRNTIIGPIRTYDHSDWRIDVEKNVVFTDVSRPYGTAVDLHERENSLFSRSEVPEFFDSSFDVLDSEKYLFQTRGHHLHKPD